MSQPKSPNVNQSSFLYADLIDQLNPKHPLLQLARRIDGSLFEEAFAGLYSRRGKPSKPVCLMVGLSILKHLEDLSNEVLIQRWVQNPYYQVFTGEIEFQWQLSCDPSDLTYFRKRIGSAGFEKILAASIALHEPRIYCMSKGKAHQRYEFGTKASITTTRDSGIGALAFEKNIFDGHTVPAVLAQVKRLTNRVPGIGIDDRGYRGKSRVNDTQIATPKPAGRNASKEAMALARKRFFRKWMREVIFWLKKCNTSRSTRRMLFAQQDTQYILMPEMNNSGSTN